MTLFTEVDHNDPPNRIDIEKGVYAVGRSVVLRAVNECHTFKRVTPLLNLAAVTSTDFLIVDK